MKKILFSICLVLTFALLMGGSCGPKDEITDMDQPGDITDRPVVDTTTEPVVEPNPPAATIDETDLQKAYFDFDKSNIRPDAQRALEHNAEVLKQYPNANIMIEGHCDERGTVEYNLALGERRANAVKSYLVRLGINASRMETISYGKERPVAFGHNEEAWQKNRRAEFRIVD